MPGWAGAVSAWSVAGPGMFGLVCLRSPVLRGRAETPRYRLQPKLDASPGESVTRRSRVRAYFGHTGPLYHCPLDHSSFGRHERCRSLLVPVSPATSRHGRSPPTLTPHPHPTTNPPIPSPRRTVSRPGPGSRRRSSSPLRRRQCGERRGWQRRMAVFGRGGSFRRAVRSVAAALVIGVFAASAAGLMPPSAASASNWAPVHSGDFPDPDILQYQGDYYAFATQSTPPRGGVQINIQVSFSTDGETWNNSGADALPDSDLGSWAVPGDTWAPSVAVFQGHTCRLRHVLHRHGAFDGRPVHRDGDCTVLHSAPTETPNPNRRCATTHRDPPPRSTTGTTAGASTPTSSPIPRRAAPIFSGRATATTSERPPRDLVGAVVAEPAERSL